MTFQSLFQSVTFRVLVSWPAVDSKRTLTWTPISTWTLWFTLLDFDVIDYALDFKHHFDFESQSDFEANFDFESDFALEFDFTLSCIFTQILLRIPLRCDFDFDFDCDFEISFDFGGLRFQCSPNRKNWP